MKRNFGGPSGSMCLRMFKALEEDMENTSSGSQSEIERTFFWGKESEAVGFRDR